MSFFNSKEQVLKFELTPYGRYLMSVGKLKPDHYEFIDDDVMYDIQHVGSSEIQNETYERVKYETPKIIPNPNLSQIMKPDISYKTNLDDFQVLTSQTLSKHQNEIGKSSPETTATPAFSLFLLDGQATGSNETYTGNSKIPTSGEFTNCMIPQVNLDLNYYLRRRNSFFANLSYDIRSISDVQQDNRVFFVSEDHVVFSLKEFGSEYTKENFDIEVYEVMNPQSGSVGTRPETLRRLVFDSNQKIIENEMIIEEKQESPIAIDVYKTVAHYFEITVDDEIDPSDLCALIGEFKKENLYIDDDFDCPDLAAPRQFDIYATRVSPEDLEDCD